MRSLALPPQVAASPTPHEPARPAFVNPYPRAAWRLAAPSALGPVVLWVDQILIRHDDARNEAGFSLGHWFAAAAETKRWRSPTSSIERHAPAPSAFRRSVERVCQSAHPRSATSSSELRALHAAFDELKAFPTLATRRSVLERLKEQERALLGPPGYAAYLSALEHELSSQLLAARDAAFERGF